MPAKTGASHAVASFVTIIIGAFLSNYLSTHSSVLWGLTRRAGDAVTSLLGIRLPEVMIGIVVIATVLSFLWGIAYHYSRHGVSEGSNKTSDRPWHE
jgi:hypothetical protein